jgi:hypothetical protein
LFSVVSIILISSSFSLYGLYVEATSWDDYFNWFDPLIPLTLSFSYAYTKGLEFYESLYILLRGVTGVVRKSLKPRSHCSGKFYYWLN